MRTDGLSLLLAWAAPTREIRSQVLTLREQGYVRMARLSGLPNRDIMFKKMLPNMLPFLAASFTGSVGTGIVASIGLEALGLGPRNTPTLGMTLSDALQSAAIAQGLCWKQVSLIPQGSMNSLNPIMRVRDQIADGIEAHEGRQPRPALRERILELLDMVRLPHQDL